jgi:hypothetical protein
MAGGATFYTAGEILNLILRAVSPTLPGTMYLRLLTTPSTKGSSGTESASFTRITLVRGTGLFTNPLLTGSSTNIGVIETIPATGTGPNIVAFDLVNTASGAFTTTYLFGNVTPSRSVIVGKRIRFPAGAMEVTC